MPPFRMAPQGANDSPMHTAPTACLAPKILVLTVFALTYAFIILFYRRKTIF